MKRNTDNPIHPENLNHHQAQSAIGALIGSAVGDALGAPFEFEPAGLFQAAFPQAIVGGLGEMTGGGAFHWGPGEFTDDTQMAVALAESLIARGEYHPDLTFKYFQSWMSGARDVGNTTRVALRHDDYRTAAERAHQIMNGRTGSNGAVMRVAPVGIMGVVRGAEWTRRVAFEQGALTHFDPIAGWCAAVVADFIRIVIADGFDASIFETLTDFVPEPFRGRINDAVRLTEQPMPGGNGGALVCTAHAFWAFHHGNTFAEVVQSAINLGDDTDTVAAVAGAMAGARFGIQGIPSRWTTYLNGVVTQPNGSEMFYNSHSIQDLAHKLIMRKIKPETQLEPIIEPKMVHDLGVWATNLPGAAASDKTMAPVSMCRTYGRMDDHPVRREVYMIDNDNRNANLESAVWDAVDSINAFLAEGRNVLVHCHGGRSRTGLVLKAWYMKTFNANHPEAIEWIESVWPHYAEWTTDFMLFLDEYDLERGLWT